MNRRGFLKFLGGAAATAAVAAPSVSYFFAPKGGWKQDDGGLWVANVPVLHTFGMLMPTYPADMYSTGMGLDGGSFTPVQPKIWYCHPKVFRKLSKMSGPNYREIVAGLAAPGMKSGDYITPHPFCAEDARPAGIQQDDAVFVDSQIEVNDWTRLGIAGIRGFSS